MSYSQTYEQCNMPEVQFSEEKQADGAGEVGRGQTSHVYVFGLLFLWVDERPSHIFDRENISSWVKPITEIDSRYCKQLYGMSSIPMLR